MNKEKIKITNFKRFMDLKKSKNNNNNIKREKPYKYNSYLSSNMKLLRHYLYNKYNCTNEKYNYKILKKLIYNINCRVVCNFKDHMLYGYVEEYLRRYYQINEVIIRMPKIFNFYNNYLQFFCKPIIHELKINKVLLNYYESKAEFYYKNYYDNKSLKNENNNKENVLNEKILVQQTIFSNSIKKKIDATTINNTLNLSINDDEFINKNESTNSTVREIIDGFYKKIKQKTEKKDKFSKIYNNKSINIHKSKQSYYKKINKEKIHNIVKKGIISISIMNNNNTKDISPFIFNNQFNKKEKSDSKSHSKSKSNIIYNKSISKSKKKLPIGNKIILKKSRNISSFNTLTKDISNTNTTTNLSRGVNNLPFQNINYSIIKPKKEITLTKTQNVEKIFSTLQGYENKGFSKKILVTESDDRKYNNSHNKINKFFKSVTKIQKQNLKNNPFIYTKNTISTNYIKNGSMTHNLLNLIFDISNNNKRKNHQYTHSNIDINFNYKNNNSKKQKSNKLSKEYVDKKIKHNENVSLNIKNNLNHLSRNQNNKKIDKGFSSYHSKCSTGFNLNINLGKKIYSNSIYKNKIKTKSKEK